MDLVLLVCSLCDPRPCVWHSCLRHMHRPWLSVRVNRGLPAAERPDDGVLRAVCCVARGGRAPQSWCSLFLQDFCCSEAAAATEIEQAGALGPPAMCLPVLVGTDLGSLGVAGSAQFTRELRRPQGGVTMDPWSLFAPLLEPV